LSEAERLDLVSVTAKGRERFVELKPAALQAFDRLVADAMSGFDLSYQLALRAP
jgi:DNA-binding MarR family transcriptional regulator